MVRMCFVRTVCTRADLRSVFLLSAESRSLRLSPGLEEERGGLSLSSEVSSENAHTHTQTTTSLSAELSKTHSMAVRAALEKENFMVFDSESCRCSNIYCSVILEKYSSFYMFALFP